MAPDRSWTSTIRRRTHWLCNMTFRTRIPHTTTNISSKSNLTYVASPPQIHLVPLICTTEVFYDEPPSKPSTSIC